MASVWAVCPKYCEELVPRPLLLRRRRRPPPLPPPLLVFFWQTHQQAGCVLAANETLAVNRLPRQKRRHHPAPGAPGSVLFSSQSARWQLQCTHARTPRSKLSLQRAPSNLSQRRRDVVVLPTITQMFPISWASPLPHPRPSSPHRRRPLDWIQNI